MTVPVLFVMTTLLLPLTRGGEGGVLPGEPVVAPHELHVSYGDLAVEGRVAVYRVRFFKDDLEAALGLHAGEARPTPMAADPEGDARFLAYFGEHFSLEVAGEALPGRIIASAEDAVDHEPVWTYTLRFDAPQAITELRITSTALFELFDDQKSVLKVVHFPDGKQRSYYMAPGEETVEIEF